MAEPSLEDLIEEARQHTMTPEERAAQSESFAFGNVSLSNPDVTREDISVAASILQGLREAIAWAKGDLQLREYTFEQPDQEELK